MKEKKININGLRELLLVGVVLLLCVVWTVMNPQFLSLNNITNILRQASYTAIAAVGMTMIIIIGEIDLSAGSLVCAAGLVGAVVCKNTFFDNIKEENSLPWGTSVIVDEKGNVNCQHNAAFYPVDCLLCETEYVDQNAGHDQDDDIPYGILADQNGI